MSSAEAHDTRNGKVDMHLEVDILPVSSVERTKQFYERVGWRLPGRIDSAETAFTSTADLAGALQRAEAAPGEHEKPTGQPDENWPAWYASAIVAEQHGMELPT